MPFLLPSRACQWALVLLCAGYLHAQCAGAAENQITVLPPGPLAPKPLISEATFARIAKKNNLSERDFTADDLQKLNAKFASVVAKLKKENVFEKIKAIAPKYGVAPEAVAASIIGEHVFNVSIVDSFQNYFISIYSKWLDKQSSAHDLFRSFISEPDARAILDTDNSDYEKWDALIDLYNSKYRGRRSYPDSGFVFAFFNPYGAGLTYGLGQLSPVRVLMANDLAVRHGGLKPIRPGDTEHLYFATLDVDTNIHYVAATNLASILCYKKYARYDISANIGVIATLYNLGAEKKRALALDKINQERAKSGQPPEHPVENFYGWYMNKKEADIKALVR